MLLWTWKTASGQKSVEVKRSDCVPASHLLTTLLLMLKQKHFGLKYKVENLIIFDIVCASHLLALLLMLKLKI